MPVKHIIRSNTKRRTRDVVLTRKKAIHFQCIECMGFQKSEVADCSDTLCPLYPFRPFKAKVRG